MSSNFFQETLFNANNGVPSEQGLRSPFWITWLFRLMYLVERKTRKLFRRSSVGKKTDWKVSDPLPSSKKKTTPPRYATDFPQKNVQSAVKNLLLLIFLHGLLFCSPELFIYWYMHRNVHTLPPGRVILYLFPLKPCHYIHDCQNRKCRTYLYIISD